MDNYQEVIVSQYVNSPRMTALMDLFNEWLDPGTDFMTFYAGVMRLDTAGTYGLDVWGRIVGVQRVIQIPVVPHFFGFAEAGKYVVGGFSETGDDGPFWDGALPLTYPYTLPNDDFRLLIKAKALYNITDGSIPAINRLLMTLFGERGDCWVEDNGGMLMTYHFDFTPTDVEYAIITKSGVLPKPVGVALNVVTA